MEQEVVEEPPSSTASNKRKEREGSRPDVSARKQRRKTLSTTCRSVKWKKVCNHPLIRKHTPSLLVAVNKLILLAYSFINYYACRLYDLDPEASVTWDVDLIRHICLGILQKTNWKADQVFQPYFLEILQEFIDGIQEDEEQNIQVLTTLSLEFKGLSFFISEVSQQIWTMCANHLTRNTWSRMLQWVQTHLLISRKQHAAAILFKAFSEHSECTSLCSDNSFECELRLALGGIFPHPKAIEASADPFVKLTTRILLDTQALNQDNDNQQSRVFSIFPLKNGFSLSHVAWSNSSLQQFLTWIQRKEFVATNEFPNFGLSCLEPNTLITKAWFDANKDSVWRSLFRVALYEKGKRAFAYRLSTNGYTCSITLEQPKKVPLVLREEESLFGLLSKSESKDYQLPPDLDVSTLTRLVGIDPGYSNLFCASIENVKTSKKTTYTLSTKQYHHESKMHEQRFYYANLLKRNPEIEQILLATPSMKTANPPELLSGARYLFTHSTRLFSFFAQSALFKYKFKVRRFKAISLTKHCKKLVGPRPKTTLVGLGDWSRSSQSGFIKGVSGSAPPNKAFLQELKHRRTNLVMLDEYKTSQHCCLCTHKLEKVRLVCQPTRRQAKRNESLPEERQTKPGLRSVHHVLHCTNNNDCGMWWNRDVCSANTDVHLLHCLVKNEPRPKHLCRGNIAAEEKHNVEVERIHV